MFSGFFYPLLEPEEKNASLKSIFKVLQLYRTKSRKEIVFKNRLSSVKGIVTRNAFELIFSEPPILSVYSLLKTFKGK